MKHCLKLNFRVKGVIQFLLGCFPVTLWGLDSIPYAFDDLHSSTVLPVDGMTFDDVESTFGPRIQTSTAKYDWHRGIDIDGVQGQNILAAYEGLFYDYRYSTRGGYTVILRHELPTAHNLLGSTTSKVFYTWYLHLFDDGNDGIAGSDDIVNGWTKYRDDPVNATAVTTGQHIGEMGASGTPGGGASYSDHLHFELRWASPSSLEFQTDYPDTTQYGFDPHLHPMLLYAPYAYGSNGPGSYLQQIEQVGSVQHGQDIVIEYSVNDDMPLLNEVIATIQLAGGGAVETTHTLNFNLRTGYDASELETLDNQNPNNDPYMAPLSFTDSTDTYRTQVIVPTEWVEEYLDGDYELELVVTDIWGNSESSVFALDPIPEPKNYAVLLGALVAVLVACRRQKYSRPQQTCR